MLTAKNPQEFSVELLMTESEGRLALWQLTEEAIGKWKDNPEFMAELYVELFWVMIGAYERGDPELQREYSNMMDSVHEKAKEYKPAAYDRFSDRLVLYGAEVEPYHLG